MSAALDPRIRGYYNGYMTKMAAIDWDKPGVGTKGAVDPNNPDMMVDKADIPKGADIEDSGMERVKYTRGENYDQLKGILGKWGGSAGVGAGIGAGVTGGMSLLADKRNQAPANYRKALLLSMLGGLGGAAGGVAGQAASPYIKKGLGAAGDMVSGAYDNIKSAIKGPLEGEELATNQEETMGQ